MISPGRVVAGALTGALLVRAVSAFPPRWRPGSEATWVRTNHAGSPVSLWEGTAVVAGCAAAGVAAVPAAAAAVVSGGLGLVDDLRGGDDGKGLRGHLVALRQGQVTTGAVKVVGLAATGLVVAAAQDRAAGRGRCSTIAAAGVIAGSANLVNLFDLRPGRALKVTLVAGLPLLPAGGFAEGVLVGSAAAALPEDLGGTRMLGDTGANALGALWGALAVRRLNAGGRAATLAVLVGLTLASERVSFSAVIAQQPLLRRLDEWGRSLQ